MADSASRARTRSNTVVRRTVRGISALGLGAGAIALTMTMIGALVSTSGPIVETSPGEKVLLTPLATRSVIYDSTGGEMALLFADEDRQEVPLSDVPEEVRQAIITIEDADFYHHKGVSLKSISRALKSDIGAGGVEQGGSTITQQLIKNSITGGEQTAERKVREAILAWRLEGQMSKDEILEQYLNTVYLGHGAYGLQAAAETYFNKSVGDLGWAEAALLASLVRNPTGYDPVAFPKISEERRDVVVSRLVAEDEIDQTTADAILDTPLPAEVFERSRATAQAQLVGGGYFSESVKQYLLDLPELGATASERYDAVFKGGLRIYSTYDPAAQAAAELAVTKVPDSGGKFFAGLAAVDPRTSAVRAMVGGPDFETSKVNYVTQGWRQPGSSFKFFVLMAAIEAGYVPDDTISGSSPCRFPDPTGPKGVYTATGGGKTASLTSQTLSSSNCGYLRLGQTVGLDKVADLANRMGMVTVEAATNPDGTPTLKETPIPSDILSLPLGSKEVHPINMAAAYGAAMNDGVYNAPYYVDKVTDSKGKVLYEHRTEGTRVVSVQTARLVTEVLAKNVTSGTGKKARLKTQVAAGKTGTTQDNADAWFVGYTPYLSTAVWLGSPQGNEKIVIKGKAAYGADYPATVWNAFNAAYHTNLAPLDFPEAEPTRRGKSIRYRNKLDSGGTRRKTTPTTRPASPAPPVETPAAPVDAAPPVAPAGA